LSTAYSKNRQHFLLKFCGTIVTVLFFTQCTWTPEVKTLIHQSEEGNIALQTSSAFKIPPQHPHVLTESLIKQILQGITQAQEKGILQELLISGSKPSPVFSPSQIAFLAPHLVDAFSQATSEELIGFQNLGTKEGTAHVSGTIALFPPAIFLLTIQNFGEYSGNPSKMASSSRNLQKHTTLMFSQEQAVLNPKEAQRLMKISSQDSWIGINYADLDSFMENVPKNELRPTTLIPSTQSEATQPGKNTLEEQLQDLRKKVDQQAEEIQRLQQTAPK